MSLLTDWIAKQNPVVHVFNNRANAPVTQVFPDRPVNVEKFILVVDLDLHIGHIPLSINLPTVNRIVMVERMDASDSDQCRSGRLNIAGLIGAAALDDRLVSVPAPPEPKARVTLRKNRML